MVPDTAKLEKKLGYVFKNKHLLWEALTFRSFLHENPGWEYGCNDRLALLGDSVLDFVVTEELLFKHPCKGAGEITRDYIATIKNEKLGKIAESMRLGKHLLIFRRANNGKPLRISRYHLASGVEAIVAAIYMDGGLESVRKFILRHIIK